ncbi:MAG TPA: VOC family protein [Anaerolineales bacterium]|nr:VOC family protein [Anaerolineales bacterium]
MTSKSDTDFRIHPDTLPGRVSLTVSDLDRQITFYENVIGLQLHGREGDTVRMGAGGEDLLHLVRVPGAVRHSRTTGIYHFAILLPSRRELARAVARLFALRWPHSPTDHVMTKTTYLDDPEGNYIELYADTPEDGTWWFEGGQFVAQWADGRPSNGLEPLDVEALLAHLEKDDALEIPMPPETRMGHFHVYVSGLEVSRRFYHEVLGFDVMGVAAGFRMGFVSAGGYHHHIGFNTWVGEGAPPPPEDSLGLRYISFNLPDRDALEAAVANARDRSAGWEETGAGWMTVDPSGNRILFETP